MNGIVLDDEIMDKLRERNPQLPRDGVCLRAVRAAFRASSVCPSRVTSPAANWPKACVTSRSNASARWRARCSSTGACSRPRMSVDIVFALVEAGILIKQDEDLIE